MIQFELQNIDNVSWATLDAYKVPCSCGFVYIWETRWLVLTRVKEYIGHYKNQEIEKSAVA